MPSEDETRPARPPVPEGGSGASRSFLFLQGPASDFFEQVARALLKRGHRVHRINLHLGDRMVWHLPATSFRGRPSEWRRFIARVMERHAVTDLVLMCPSRPYHVVAEEEARARGITVFCTDLGYLRPDWLTLELDGMTSWSRLPRAPQAVRDLAAQFAPPDLAPRFPTPFALLAITNIIYNLAELIGRPLYPHYRRHAIFHPLAEGAGWAATFVHRAFGAERERARLEGAADSYFLFALQLATDFQLRVHSPYADQRDAIRDVLASFAAHGTGHRLVLVVHPLDNGLIGWRGFAMRLAAGLGVADRVVVLHGGMNGPILRRASGLITINSTVGLSALQEGVPVKVLGNAVFDIAGMTSQAPLDSFWNDPPPPDPALVQDFVRAVAGTTQIKGGYFRREAKAAAVAAFTHRLVQGLPALPPRSRPAGVPRLRGALRGIAITGAAHGIGLALARAYARPGTLLCLIDTDADRLATAADDCRRRGAEVQPVRIGTQDIPALRIAMEALGRAALVDTVIACLEPAATPRPEVEAPALAAVHALAEPLCRHGGGRIALITPRALLAAHGEALRRHLGENGVAVSVACPGFMEAAAPGARAITADRAAELICRAVTAGRPLVALPRMLPLPALAGRTALFISRSPPPERTAIRSAPP